MHHSLLRSVPSMHHRLPCLLQALLLTSTDEMYELDVPSGRASASCKQSLRDLPRRNLGWTDVTAQQKQRRLLRSSAGSESNQKAEQCMLWKIASKDWVSMCRLTHGRPRPASGFLSSIVQAASTPGGASWGIPVANPCRCGAFHGHP